MLASDGDRPGASIDLMGIAVLRSGAAVMPGTTEPFPRLPANDRSWRDYRAADVGMESLSTDERQLVRGVFITLCGVIAVQKLAVPGWNLELNFFVATAFTAWAFVRGHLAVNPTRLFGFVLVSAGALLITLAAHATAAFSLPSLLFLVLLHLPFIFCAEVRRDVYVMILKRFQLIALFIASLVLLQWAEQGAGLRMTNLEDYLPHAWLYQTFVYVQKVNYVSPWYKPNGIFMLEASFTSQLLAMALVIEICILKRMRIIMVLLLGMVLAFAGTGIIMVLITLPFIAVYLSKRTVWAGIISAPTALLLGWQLGFLANALGRTTEIARPGTSGSGRLVAPMVILWKTLTNIPSAVFVGIGPGVVNPFYSNLTDMLNPTAKIITEYGLPLGLLWLVWFHFCTVSARVPAAITCVVLIQYDVTGGGLLVPLQTYYCLFLSAMIVPARVALQNPAPTGP